MTFEDLGFSDDVMRAITDCGYTEPTPIQAKAIPHILMTRDVVGLAQTGTGKTASFTLPMIEILSGGRAKARMPRSLILCPTRELAAQVAENFDTYGKYVKLSKALLVGGSSMAKQVALLERGVDVLIATPGRLLDLFDRGQILLTDIKVLVIDEADRMLDMGFIPDIEKIVSKLPPFRQTLLFSATMPPEIRRLTEQFLDNPREVAVAAPASTADTVVQNMVWTDQRSKYEVLGKIIASEKVENAFIFCNRKKDIAGLAQWLRRNKYNAEPLHGDMAQSARTQTLQNFKDGKITLLVCSDVAGRGIDVKNISHVFNFDVPTHADDYVHRIGRTGRAGQDGHAWMLAMKSEQKYVDAIEARIKTKIPVRVIGSGGGSGKTGDTKSQGQRNTSEKKVHKKPESKKTEYKKVEHKNPYENNVKQQEHSPKPKANRDNNNGDNPVVGFGDDVPSFLK